jgi:hypothetical protein
MQFDVRWPLGFIFLTIGAILLAYALLGALPASDATINSRCGLGMSIFGAGCIVLAHRAAPVATKVKRACRRMTSTLQRRLPPKVQT